jgi:long-chain acyl-CoA synthetase
VTLIPYEKVLANGKEKTLDYNSEEFKVKPEDCLTFSYTSGTTGPPKGAMVSQKNFCSFMAAEKCNPDTCFNSDDVVLSYLPLPHILEREFDYAVWHKGGRVVYFSGDVQKLKDDLTIVKPTVFLSVPRLFSRFYDVLKQKFAELQGWTKTALDYALKTKLANL